MNDFQRRARNALLGLAVGDAIGWPSMFHRSRLLPVWTRRIRREIDAEREDAGVLRVSMPFSLNQPAEVFELSPTDDTEWAAWTIENLLKHRCLIEAEWLNEAWQTLANGSERLLGWVSTRTALENIRRGVMPPSSGRDNPHYFDDGALCRSVPIGIAYAGRLDEASRAAAIDASVTNFEDGVWVAQSLAVAVSAACAGESILSVIDAALGVLPESSWSRRTVEQALHICEQDGPVMALIPSLHKILNREYSDGCVGPETLSLSLAIASKTSDRFDEAVSTALAFAKGADAIPAIVGAIVGAMAPGTAVTVQWEHTLGSLKGICLPMLAGRDYLQLVDDFIRACPSPTSREART